MPKCSYDDRRKTGYLCEHIFAVFEIFPSWLFKRFYQYTITDVHQPSRCHSYQNKNKNEIVSSLEEPDETDETTAINPQHLRSQAR